jgi:hypothetical protein
MSTQASPYSAALAAAMPKNIARAADANTFDNFIKTPFLTRNYNIKIGK